MDTRSVIFLRDRFVPPDEATVSIFDRGYLYGDAVFETLRSYAGRVFRPGAHLDRLGAAAARLGIALPLERDALERALRDTIARFGSEDATVRVTLSRGEGTGGIATTGDERPTLSIVARPLEPYPAVAYARGIASGFAETRKVPPQCLPSELKTANYLSSILARRELDARGMTEGVQLAVDGAVVSGTVSNVFFVAAGRLVTPDVASGCRAGVTREVLLEIAGQLAIFAETRRVEARELAVADEIFFANTLMECLPVASFEGRALAAPGPRTRALHDALRARISDEGK